jgi:hypothetical protein
MKKLHAIHIPIPNHAAITREQYSPFWFRFFEILPGLCVWGSFVLIILGSLFYPLAVTVFIVLFDVSLHQKSL